MGLHESERPKGERPKRNIVKNAVIFGIPVAIAVSQAACVGGAVYDINIPSCDIDPQAKTKTLFIDYHRSTSTPDIVRIEGITIAATITKKGDIDLNQDEQPEENRIETFRDGHMEFKGINGRAHYISTRPHNSIHTLTELTIRADCETTPKTDS